MASQYGPPPLALDRPIVLLRLAVLSAGVGFALAQHQPVRDVGGPAPDVLWLGISYVALAFVDRLRGENDLAPDRIALAVLIGLHVGALLPRLLL